MGAESVIDLCAVTVHADRRCLLDVDCLCVEQGGIVALMGPNGAGKTTLLRVCLGLVKHAQGQVVVLSENVRSLRGARLAMLRRRIGYVPQLLPARSELPLTVREVVAIGRTARIGLFKRLTRGDWEIVDRWVERLGLTALADRPFGTVSGGEQRKTIIARAMVQEPELLLLDEPTANLDLGWRERIVETIDQIYMQTRISVVLVCHELEVLPPSCHRVALLESGRLVSDGAPEEVFTETRVTELYGDGLRPWHEAGRHALVPGVHRDD
ncbi:MAG: metal ABC transporter ATP-binding protein [Verrucomicrobiia bacterium]